MDPLGAVADPAAGRVEGVAVAGLAPGLTLDEADRLTVDDIHGGQQVEAHGWSP